MISVSSSGSFKKTETFLNRLKRNDHFKHLEQYGQEGVDALASATPVDSSLTASSWTYKVTHSRKRHTITWNNTNIVSGVQIAVILQYGHATGSGGWVEGIDYINPVIRPIMDRIANDVWKEVTRDG